MALASVVHGLFAVDMEHMPLAYGRGAEDLVVRDDLHCAVCVETAGDGALHAAADGLGQAEVHMANAPAAQVLRGQALAAHADLIILRPVHRPGLRHLEAQLGPDRPVEGREHLSAGQALQEVQQDQSVFLLRRVQVRDAQQGGQPAKNPLPPCLVQLRLVRYSLEQL